MDNPLRRLSLDQLRQRTSVKWRTYDSDVLPLWVAEMDVELAEPVARALVDAVEAGDTGYPAGTGYASALAAFASKRWGWAPDVSHTALVPDVMTGVVEMIKLVSGPGSAVVVNSPVYPPFYEFLASMGRPVVEAQLTADGRIDFASLEEALQRASVYLLCSPHNPTGAVHTAAELAEVARLARAYGVRVVVDEIHAPIVAAGVSFVPYLSVPGGENGLSVMSASKAWNLAGLKAALAIAGTEAVEDLGRLPEVLKYGPSHLGNIAHAAALRDGALWLDAVLAGFDENRVLLASLLREHLPAVRYTPAEGTYLAWLDCRELGLGDDPAEAFLRDGRVAVSSGIPFGTGGAGFVRMNLATSPEIITEAVRRMAVVVR